MGIKNINNGADLQDTASKNAGCKNAELFDFDIEQLKKSKCNFLIGTDEAGRGPAVAPVFAAAVCFKKHSEEIIQKLNKLNDSKQITEKARLALYPLIKENAVYSIQTVDEAMIDRINILNATCEAMKNACMDVVRQLKTTCIVLVDGNNKIRGYEFPQRTVIKGDAKSASIAAASILAKVERDNLLIKLDREFPMYGWKNNKGYLSQEHIKAIKKYGITKYHRKSFVRNILDNLNIEQQKLKLV